MLRCLVAAIATSMKDAGCFRQSRWLSIRLETLGALSAFAAAALAVEQGGAASVVGLSLSYALQITQLTNMTVCCVVSLEGLLANFRGLLLQRVGPVKVRRSPALRHGVLCQITVRVCTPCGACSF